MIDETSTTSLQSAAEDTAELSVLEESTEERLVLHVVGEADAMNARSLLDDLRSSLSRHPSAVLVDLSGLTFCDLAGLGALRHFRSEAVASGVRTSVEGMSPVLAWLEDAFPHPGTTRMWAAGRASGSPDSISGVPAEHHPRAWPVR